MVLRIEQELGERLGELGLADAGRSQEQERAVRTLRVAEKRNDDAIRLLSRAAELQPKSETAHYNLMLAYRNAGRPDDARKEKAIVNGLQKPPEGEFTDFLKKLGEKV